MHSKLSIIFFLLLSMYKAHTQDNRVLLALSWITSSVNGTRAEQYVQDLVRQYLIAKGVLLQQEATNQTQEITELGVS